MKKFIIKILIFVIFIIFINIVLVFQADGLTDVYYPKLSSAQQTSLILGASRANEGVVPRLLDSVMSGNGDKISFYNFSFSNSDSPYGEVYLNAIKSKIKRDSQNGVFILSVHPWSISTYLDKEFKPIIDIEKKLTLGKVTQFSGSPNFNYFLNAYEFGWGNILLKKLEYNISLFLNKKNITNKGQTVEVTEKGWLKRTYFQADLKTANYRMENKIKQLFDGKKFYYKFSEKRKNSLEKTVDYLKKHGTVYLVRLPTNQKIRKLENRYMPNLDALMNSIATKHGVKYLQSTNDYSYSDGNHLDQESAAKYSIQLAQQISKTDEFKQINKK